MSSLNPGNASNGREMYVCSNMGNYCTYILHHFTCSILSKWYLQHSLPPSSIPLPSPSPSLCRLPSLPYALPLPSLPYALALPSSFLDLSGVWTMHSRGSIHPYHVRRGCHCEGGGVTLPGRPSSCKGDTRKLTSITRVAPPFTRSSCSQAATGDVISSEELGGADVHCRISGCTDHYAATEEDALSITRLVVACLNLPPRIPTSYSPGMGSCYLASVGLFHRDTLCTCASPLTPTMPASRAATSLR